MNLVYKFRRFLGTTDFLEHFMIPTPYKKIGYNMDITRQTACMVVNLFPSLSGTVLKINDGSLLNLFQKVGG